jgi:tRNA threonylcarbamoyladenosine biosynthesis protein TsaE
MHPRCAPAARVSPRASHVVADSPEATRLAGERLGARLRAGQVVALIGDLGAGKTCFAQGLLRGLGVRAGVTSPTFVLVNHYRGRLPVHHVDAYRVATLSELLDLGLDEMWSAEAVTVVEWADKFLPLLPADRVTVRIAGLGDEPREIAIEEPDGMADGMAPVSESGH